jgi:hypothetical protein
MPRPPKLPPLSLLRMMARYFNYHSTPPGQLGGHHMEIQTNENSSILIFGERFIMEIF